MFSSLERVDSILAEILRASSNGIESSNNMPKSRSLLLLNPPLTLDPKAKTHFIFCPGIILCNSFFGPFQATLHPTILPL